MNKQTKAYAVYALYWPGRPEVYIGCSKNARERLNKHRSTGCSSLISQCKRLFGQPQMLLIDECDTQESAWAAEAKWIRLLRSDVDSGVGGLNMTFGKGSSYKSDGGERWTPKRRSDARGSRIASSFKWHMEHPEQSKAYAERGRQVMTDPELAQYCSDVGGAAMDDPEIRQRCFDRQAEVHQSVWWNARTQAGMALYWAKQQGIPHSVLTRPKYPWGKKV